MDWHGYILDIYVTHTDYAIRLPKRYVHIITLQYGKMWNIPGCPVKVRLPVVQYGKQNIWLSVLKNVSRWLNNMTVQ